jgi:hypothetical protein
LPRLAQNLEQGQKRAHFPTRAAQNTHVSPSGRCSKHAQTHREQHTSRERRLHPGDLQKHSVQPPSYDAARRRQDPRAVPDRHVASAAPRVAIGLHCRGSSPGGEVP